MNKIMHIHSKRMKFKGNIKSCEDFENKNLNKLNNYLFII